MELPRRPKGDEYTRPGRYQELQARVRRAVAGKNVPVLFVYAFDRRARLGPFLFVDKKLVPGAPIAVASALAGVCAGLSDRGARRLATSILADYSSADPEQLVDLILGPISPVTQWDNIGFRVARTIKTAH
jgi:hypothetical protein